MIPKDTVDKIIETSRIEEVVGDFVSLKRRGTSMIGLCPFHNEKTPSFHVSVGKGIFKCFGCGKGGDSVRFIMEHEKATYPEALRYLANKYSIEIAEVENTPEEQAVNDRRESLYIVSAWAAKFFQQQMLETDEGKSIGLSYFKERGFRDDIIKKFELGYSPDVWDALTQSAITEGYNIQFLEETGLTIRKENEKFYDRFRGRVMFPIHSFTGRVIGFGGRTLKTDKAVPKYVNSPESDIYHKSNVLYGLFFAKKSMRDEDNCYLVEGYADVLSVHQAGIENVVASSGTSLTIEQIRMIGRFTKNITILYDGDDAGIKASLRGLDMILEEGLNVKIVLFPDGDDPDSYVQKFGSAAFKSHIEGSKKDFILFKTSILLKDAGNDPIKRAGIIREVVESIAKIPDGIKASVFVRECSSLLQIEERVLISELNKIRLGKIKKDSNFNTPQVQSENVPEPNMPEPAGISDTDEAQEKEIVRLLLNYGHELVHWDDITDTYIAPYIISNLADVTFEHPQCIQIIEEYKKQLENGELPSEQDFIKNSDHQIADLAIAMVSSPYILSENWYARRKIYVRNEGENLRSTILGGIFHLKKRKVDRILRKIRDEIQAEQDADNQAILMRRYMQVKEVEKGISMFLGSVILK
ncbi:MAG: DNA primase [Sphingobacteriales bacterium 17-39-43]|uniref:DNA primase n=1 Tax=Daejeonella sp. TaxID=2805397 RepID=UPI000BCEB2CE|nr:DNA primase [Daejeonella sp.]OYZ32378.1 MAG: DNA primase [Sphingobacteriales bacterium 16-39-50]OZA25742.1 MAG: DNA primase [Sphingobacteriales bacterium 17-39-43]HQT22071.1 DNA primase [Daejeonella sp.]HQT57378.1 DNA primase [Daejeonella sp.]